MFQNASFRELETTLEVEHHLSSEFEGFHKQIKSPCLEVYKNYFRAMADSFRLCSNYCTLVAVTSSLVTLVMKTLVISRRSKIPAPELLAVELGASKAPVRGTSPRLEKSLGSFVAMGYPMIS
jgi:hypothetical protein